MYFGVRVESGFALCEFFLIPQLGPGLLSYSQKLWIDELASGANRIGRLPVGAKQLGELAEC